MSFEVPQTIVVPHSDYRVVLSRLDPLHVVQQGIGLYVMAQEVFEGNDMAVLREFGKGFHRQYDNGVAGAMDIVTNKYSANRRDVVGYMTYVDGWPAGWARMSSQPTAIQAQPRNIPIKGYNFSWVLTERYRGKGIGTKIAPQVLGVADALAADAQVSVWQGEAWTTIRNDNEASIRLVLGLGFAAVGIRAGSEEEQIYVRKSGPTYRRFVDGQD